MLLLFASFALAFATDVYRNGVKISYQRVKNLYGEPIKQASPVKLKTYWTKGSNVLLTRDNVVVLRGFTNDSRGAWHCVCHERDAIYEISKPVEILPAVDPSWAHSRPRLIEIGGVPHLSCPQWHGVRSAVHLMDSTHQTQKSATDSVFPLLRTGEYKCVASNSQGKFYTRALVVRFPGGDKLLSCPHYKMSWIVHHWPTLVIAFALCLMCVIVTSWIIHCVGGRGCRLTDKRKIADSHYLVMPRVRPSYLNVEVQN